jgi:hypothetical protein
MSDKIELTETGRVNKYRCDNGHITTTIDAQLGVTPFMILCRHCGETAKSAFYTQPHSRTDKIDAVWLAFWPSPLSEFEKLHQDKGGLFLHYLESEKNG